MKYTIIENDNHLPVIKAEDKNGNILFIPMDEANSDYQRYLNPETEQSTPIVATE